jgi:hypothetical protein
MWMKRWGGLVEKKNECTEIVSVGKVVDRENRSRMRAIKHKQTKE